MYLKLSGDPNNITQHVLDKIERCITLLHKHNVVITNQKDHYTPSLKYFIKDITETETVEFNDQN